MSMIYWFSGTGNSLFAAKHLSAELGGIPLYPIAKGAPAEPVGGAGEKIGFVFPSYYGNLPRAVRAFVENLKIVPGTYIFAVVTMGGVGQGSVDALEKALHKKELTLDYGRVILMPANYVVKYNPADKNKVEAKLKKTIEKVRKISSEISAGTRSVKGFKFTASNLYKDIESLDSQFHAENSCTSCGQCGKICPVVNINMENGKPVWLHHCERCVACISWCPAQAIQYGDLTKTRRRYQNPDIKAGEIAIVKPDNLCYTD